MATQEYIDDLIIVIETAEDAGSVTNQMVAAVLDFLNVNLKKVSQGEEVLEEEAARIAADAALQKAIDAVSLRIDRLVGNNASQAIDNFNEILNFLNGLKDSDSLAALLADINTRIGSEDGSQSEDGSLWGKLKSLSQDISSCSEDISTLQIDRDKIKQELQQTAGLQVSTFTNVNNFLNAGTVYSDLSGVFTALKTADKINNVRKNGVILSFLTADGWVTKQFRGNPDTDFENVEKWEDFGSGGSAGGNTYNVTGNMPLTEGFYTLASAIAAVPDKWRDRGRVITFETSLGKWETYQFTGTALDVWEQEASWEEFGGKGTVKSVTVNGEKQTPYFIILAASLMQCYPRSTNCARLAFVDEAFAALSIERIEQMVNYFEMNGFQVLYAAPPEKINSIGSHIDSTVSLVNKGRYTKAVEGLVDDIIEEPDRTSAQDT